MGHAARALDLLLSSADEPRNNRQLVETCRPSEPHDIMSKVLVPPEELSGLQLAYALYEAMDASKLVGSPTGAFAYFNIETDSLVVVSDNDNKVIHASLDGAVAQDALQAAKTEGATFTVLGEDVICSVLGFTQSGSSYGEAAMRALLAYKRGRLLTRIAEQT